MRYLLSRLKVIILPKPSSLDENVSTLKVFYGLSLVENTIMFFSFRGTRYCSRLLVAQPVNATNNCSGTYYT
jgi:hypothetical protein